MLEKRALRYRRKVHNKQDADDVLYDQALDETGTVATATLSDSDDDSVFGKIDIQQQFREIEGIKDELLTVHGVAPGRKAEGVSRLVMENVNGFNTTIGENEKLAKAKEINDELEADIIAYTEHRINSKHKLNRNGLSQMFQGGESEIRSVGAHNVHENIGRTQEGGTALLLYGPLIEQYDFEHSGKEDTGLGRWVVMVFRGSEGIITRIICGYNPCYNNKTGSKTSYQQHRRYFITKEKDRTCPRQRFRDDLVKKLQEWRDAGDRLVVCMDANEDIYNKSIGKALTDTAGLGMKEVVSTFTGQKIGATFFRGTNPIDGIWATSDIVVVGACVMPCGYGVGDHRMFIVDFLTSSLIGHTPPKIIRSAARRLNTLIPSTARNYTTKLERLILEHRLTERLVAAHQSSPIKAVIKQRVDAIDAEGKQYMEHCEKKCRRIKSGRIPFSPDSSVWIRRAQVYRSILRFHAGLIRNRSNLKRAARRCGIPQPLHMPLKLVKERLKLAKGKCKYFRKHGHRYRRQHLKNRLTLAQQRQDEEAEKRILTIIQREKDRAYWRRLKYSMSKPQGRSIRIVQAELEFGEVIDFEGQEVVQNEIWSRIHDQRFYLAEQAPICQGRLRGEFGYLAKTKSGKEVLDGTYNYSPTFHAASRSLLEECAIIRKLIPANSVSNTIQRPAWQRRWLRAKEKTSSSVSGIHFGHYRAGAESRVISNYHAMKTTIALKLGFHLDRWAKGLSVMLEKKPGVTIIEKLRSILLMEADFNGANKEIFGDRMMNNVRIHGLMPEEIFSDKGKTSGDGTLAKTLFWDIVRQARVCAGLASIDAANCYDSIAHAIASLVFQAFGVPEEAVESMLTAIQEMKYFLRTAYGDSKNFRGSTIQVKFQGLCQGNGAASAGWAVISIVIVGAHKREGHGGHFVCPISKLSAHLSAILFVDDTDLLHIDLRANECIEETYNALQASIEYWGQLLLASGGAFKPIKCFSYLVSFSFRPDGRWFYDKNELNEAFDMAVPMPDGNMVSIEHCSVETVKETLGNWTCPSGAAEETLKAMQEKAQAWVDRAKEGKLMRRDVWFLLDRQMWPGVGFGIGSCMASWKQLSLCLKKQYWQIIPMGGVIRTANAELRQQDRGFYGVGCPHPGVECLVDQLNLLLMHYGCSSAVGLKQQISLEYMVLELGLSLQPFQQSYSKYGDWVTHSWLKTIWEKCDRFQIKIHFADVPLEIPREGDKWLMKEFMRLGYSMDKLQRLNRVRLFMQVLFLSDILGASGKSLDKKYLQRRREDEQWSKLRFPREKPPRKDVLLWEEALQQLAPGGCIADRLGRFLAPGHKIWDWRLDTEANELCHHHDGVMDIYTKTQSSSRVSRSSNRWGMQLLNQPQVKRGEICTIREISPTVVGLVSTASPPRPKTMPTCFIDVLLEWNNTWMWDSLRLVGDDHWIEDSIRTGSLVAVTDGSYIKERYPNLCSAAFVFECSEGRGRIIGSFAEGSSAANAFRGELLGLMAIHLILLAVNTIDKTLPGEVTIYSDCLGALNGVATLPETRIPNRCKHSDILKNIMIHCRSLSFTCKYLHVKAHQDDHLSYHLLLRPSQLNCLMDGIAKSVIWGMEGHQLPPQEVFPLESVSVFIGNEKMTSDTGSEIRFWAHKQLAEAVFFKLKIMDPMQFKQVAWRFVYETLHEVPRLFQLWAAKQVTDLAGTNYKQSTYKDRHSPICPSCDVAIETCAHVLHCREAGRVAALLRSIELLDDWLDRTGTDKVLRRCLVQFAKGRGGQTMIQITCSMSQAYRRLASSQDEIGWRRFMEGMISKEMLSIQQRHLILTGSTWTIAAWAKGLVVKLLETTHGQWLYRNVHVHDTITGTHAIRRKETIRQEIQMQLDMGGEGMAEEDKYLLEINLEELDITSGEAQEYWLLAIQAARMSRRLRVQQQNNGANPGTTLSRA